MEQLQFQIRLKTGERYLGVAPPGVTFINIINGVRNFGYYCDYDCPPERQIYVALDAIAAIIPMGTILTDPGQVVPFKPHAVPIDAEKPPEAG